MTNKESAGLWLALIILAGVAALAYRSIDAAADTLAWVEHTHAVLQQLDAESAAFARASAARRAFAVAGDASQLGDVPDLDARAFRATDAIRASIADNPDQLRRLDSLTQLLHERLSSLDAAVERRQTGGSGAETSESLAVTARIRAAREGLEAEENRLLAERDVRTRTDIERTKLAELVGTLASFAILLFAFGRLRQEVERRRRSEQALKTAKDAADAANRELEAFSYSVAHDLRAPLRGMNGFAQLLLETYADKLDAEGKDWLQGIGQNAAKMGGLIDALLALARVTRSDMKPERVDLSEVVRDAATQLRASEPDRRIDIQVQSELSAAVDPGLARALVENLLGNAWKFTGKVSAPRIEFGATDKDGSPTFFLRDNGAGFDMAFASKLFAPFQRLHTAHEFPGTGIGLATVQRIVQRHGGRVWAEGAVDRGATFFFVLPAGASAQEATS